MCRPFPNCSEILPVHAYLLPLGVHPARFSYIIHALATFIDSFCNNLNTKNQTALIGWKRGFNNHSYKVTNCMGIFSLCTYSLYAAAGWKTEQRNAKSEKHPLCIRIVRVFLRDQTALNLSEIGDLWAFHSAKRKSECGRVSLINWPHHSPP